jgi:hypothetical protein
VSSRGGGDLYTCAHGVITLVCFISSATVGFAEFDHLELERSVSAAAAGAIASVLLLPGRLVWTSWASKNLPNSLEWVLFIANSTLWGALGTAVTARIAGRKAGSSY